MERERDEVDASAASDGVEDGAGSGGSRDEGGRGVDRGSVEAHADA